VVIDAVNKCGLSKELAARSNPETLKLSRDSQTKGVEGIGP
jgi:hypothetical protein